MQNPPILWSFRRCPYAMRARLAIQSAGVTTELREILLKDKPAVFLAASASGTVPALEADTIIGESRDIMIWALKQNDPEGWLEMPDMGYDLITINDGPFKTALDHTKYAVRHPEKNEAEERAKASEFLHDLNAMLTKAYLFKDTPSLADMAILPFVRQFANTDRAWFDTQDWPSLIRWLDAFTASSAFANIMTKYPPWQSGQSLVHFPPEGAIP